MQRRYIRAAEWARVRQRWVVYLLLSLHGGLLACSAALHSPVNGEVPALAAGIRHWQEGRFDLYRVTPPLVRMVAALPVLAMQPATDWSRLQDAVGRRPEFDVGDDFIRANGERSFCLFTAARWACIPFSILGGYICFRWARELYGVAPGIMAAILWCFSPAIIAHAQLISGDGVAMAMGVVAGYLLWCWLCHPTWYNTALVGLVLGLTELTKTTWIMLFLLWPTLWFAWKLTERPLASLRGCGREAIRLTTILLLGICLINLGYGGEGSFHRFGDIRFISGTLAGAVDYRNMAFEGGNRFSKSCLASVRVPLPLSYVQGIDIQKRDFEACRHSYLAGYWAGSGWWYYYFYALAVKEPLGTWCLAALAIGMTVFGRRHKRSSPPVLLSDKVGGRSASWRDEMIVLLPGLTLLVFVSSQTGFSVHSRYVIPALPFFYVWISKVARVFETRPQFLPLSGQRRQVGWRHKGIVEWFRTRRNPIMAIMVALALAWSIGSSLSIYPHSLSYFNELAIVLPTPADASYPQPINTISEDHGVWSTIKYMLTAGPRNGPRHLLDSNIDWGQDLFYLKDWLDRHPDAKLDGLAYWGSYPATLAGVPATPYPPSGPEEKGAVNSAETGLDTEQFGPKPGWYALSVNYIYGRDRQYRYFLHFQPTAMAGYSIYIYHITTDEANRIRRELGLPELTMKERTGHQL